MMATTNKTTAPKTHKMPKAMRTAKRKTASIGGLAELSFTDDGWTETNLWECFLRQFLSRNYNKIRKSISQHKKQNNNIQQQHNPL